MKNWWIWLVLGIAFALRVGGLNNFPPGFTPDEASFGYDAYSILKTGKDQWGRTFPLVLESFGDFKSPLYAYLDIPFVAMLGLTKVAVRLPNALLGTAAVYVVYLLAGKLFNNKKIALSSAMLLAISPWHIMMSRGAFEANLTTFFLPLGVYFWLTKRYFWSGLILGLNLFTYHSAKIVTPLSILGLFYLYRPKLNKKFLTGAFVFVIFLALTGFTFFSGAAGRASERSITQGALEAAFSQRKVSSVSGLFHNKYTVVVKRFTSNYFTYLSPQFLFTNGPREGTYGMIPGRGVLYWFSLPLLVGYFAVKKKKADKLLLMMLLVAPIPAAMATGVGYHANRAVIMLPTIQILMGVGAVYLFSKIKSKRLLIMSALIILGFFVFFLEDYFIQSPHKIGKAMLSGNLETAYKITREYPDVEVEVNKKLSEPHIYIAFASGVTPEVYQAATKSWNYKQLGVNWVDQMPEYSLENYTFKNLLEGVEYIIVDVD